MVPAVPAIDYAGVEPGTLGLNLLWMNALGHECDGHANEFLNIGTTFRAPPKPAVNDARIFWSGECRRSLWQVLTDCGYPASRSRRAFSSARVQPLPRKGRASKAALQAR
jgi:hypothetical protein